MAKFHATEQREANGFPTEYCLTHGSDLRDCNRDSEPHDADRGYPIALSGWVSIHADGRVSIEVDLDVSDHFGDVIDPERIESTFTRSLPTRSQPPPDLTTTATRLRPSTARPG